MVQFSTGKSKERYVTPKHLKMVKPKVFEMEHEFKEEYIEELEDAEVIVQLSNVL